MKNLMRLKLLLSGRRFTIKKKEYKMCIDCIAFCITFGYTNTRKVV